MPIPDISSTDALTALSNKPGLTVTDVTYLAQGGQKVVYSCLINGSPYVAKFLLIDTPRPVPNDMENADATMPDIDAVTSRARREVDTMLQCNIPTLVKLGPIGLNSIQIKNQNLLYFTEEKIIGDDLRTILTRAPMHKLQIPDVVQLAKDITDAVDAIWALARVHRDIKPGNIMRRSDTGQFVLLDVGLVFDLHDISLTATNIIVGTPIYFSPEQMEYARKRQLDFRSDLFSLGIVLYEAATGQHPFTINCVSTTEVMAAIAFGAPPLPTTLGNDIPSSLENIIMRLLSKSPHLRYRTCGQLKTHLLAV